MLCVIGLLMADRSYRLWRQTDHTETIKNKSVAYKLPKIKPVIQEILHMNAKPEEYDMNVIRIRNTYYREF